MKITSKSLNYFSNSYYDKKKIKLLRGYRKSYSVYNYDIEVWYLFPFNLIVRYWRDLLLIIYKKVYLKFMISFKFMEKPKEGCCYRKDFIQDIFRYLGGF